MDPAEAEVRVRRSGFRRGFFSVLLVVAVLVLIYLFAPEIGASVPALEPAMASYVDAANALRAFIDGLLARSIESLGAMLPAEE